MWTIPVTTRSKCNSVLQATSNAAITRFKHGKEGTPARIAVTCGARVKSMAGKGEKLA